MLAILCDQCDSTICEIDDPKALPPILSVFYSNESPSTCRHFCNYRCLRKYTKEAVRLEREVAQRSAEASALIASALTSALGGFVARPKSGNTTTAEAT